MDDSIDRPLPSPSSETRSDVRDAADCLLTSRHDDFNRPSDLIPTITPSQEPVDYMLRFLSSADNLTLTWLVTSLAIVTYVLLGRIGLLLIGLVAGVAIHASWEAADTGLRGDPTGTSSIYRRKELSLNIANRLLELSSRKPPEPKSNGGIIAEAAEGMCEPELDFSGFPPKTAAALRSLTNAVIKDYVKYVRVTYVSTRSDRIQVTGINPYCQQSKCSLSRAGNC